MDKAFQEARKNGVLDESHDAYCRSENRTKIETNLDDYIEEKIQTYQEQLYFVTFLLGESKEKYQLYVPVDIKVSALQYLVYLFSTFSFIVAYRKPQECQVEQ